MIIIIILIVVLLIALWCVNTVNGFKKKEIRVQEGLSGVQAARRLYNASVTSYNTAIAMFPAKLLAGSRRPKEFFAADASKREDVKMTF